MIVFISGTAGFKGYQTIARLPDFVRNHIAAYMAENAEILVGDCIGIDSLVQEYLLANDYKNVAVYCSGNKCRNNLGNWTVIHCQPKNNETGRDFYAVKDKAMCENADKGFAVWDGRSKGTKNNIDHMTLLGKPVIIFRTDKCSFESR